ncbi:MAG: FMN-binding protein, partial [Paludibacteraceae bacterium]|nr:FMN-binding protein [Paludibacteraceae bacterium]
MKKLESSFMNMVIVLTIITIVAAACLGAMNNATAEPIAASKKAKQEAAIKAVLPEFTSIEEDSVNNQKIFRAYDANRAIVGIAIETAELGFGGNVTTMVGFDANGVLVDYSLLQHAETPGLGSKL